MQTDVTPCLKNVPPMVYIIIAQAARNRASGKISPSTFDQNIRRLERELLEKQGLALLVCDLADGRTRFLIKQRNTGTVCDLLEFTADGKLETGHAEPREHSAPARQAAYHAGTP